MTVIIAQGTKATKEKGTVALDLVKVTVVSEPPAAATGNRLIGTVYKFEPDGAAFDPPISIAFPYDRAKLPSDVTEAKLTIASYKDSTAGWLAQQSAVNTTDTTVTAKAAGLSVLGIMAPINAPVNVSTARPAAFSLSNLKASPDRVTAGANVQVSVDLTNTGDLSGDYTAQLQVNQKPEASKTVTLAGGQTQTVSFSVSKTAAGGYMVQVGDKSAEFTVYRPASFTVSTLTLTPINKDGTSVAVSAMVANNGDIQGDRTVELKVNGVKEGATTVTVAPASMQKATFSVVKAKPGRYDVEIEGLTSSFTVSGPGTTRWVLIAEIVGAAIAGGAIWYFVVRRFFNANRGTKPTNA